MKDRNTILFFLFIGAGLITFACLAPIYSSIISSFVMVVGILLTFFAGYLTLTTQFRGKSAFTIINEPKAQNTAEEIALKKSLQAQAFSIKRL